MEVVKPLVRLLGTVTARYLRQRFITS